MIIAFAGLYSGIAQTGIFDTIRTDGAGANSFPIIPAPAILYYFALLFFSGCYLYRRIAQRNFNDDCLALIIFSIPMISAALGRCDPGHLVSNGGGFVLASMFFASTYKKLWRRYQVLYILFIFLFPTLAGLVFFRIPFERIAQMKAPHPSADGLTDLNLAQIYPNWSGNFFVPWGFKPNFFGTSSFNPHRLRPVRWIAEYERDSRHF